MLPAGRSTTLWRYFGTEAGAERKPATLVEQLDPAVRVCHGGRRMPGRREPQDSRLRVHDGVDDRREGRLERVAREPIELREHRLRLQPLHGERAQRVS